MILRAPLWQNLIQQEGLAEHLDCACVTGHVAIHILQFLI